MNPATSPPRPNGIIRPYSEFIVYMQRGLDALLIAASLAGAVYYHDPRWSTELTIAAVLAIVVFQITSTISGVYRSWRGTRFADEIGPVIGSWLSTAPLLLLAAFLTKTTDQFSRVIMTAWLCAAPAAMILARFQVRAVLRFLRRSGRNLRRVVVAGATDSGVKLCSRISALTDSGNRVLGIYDDRAAQRLKDDDLGGAKLLGNLQMLISDARAHKVDVVYIALPLRAERRIRDLVYRLADTTATVYVVTDLFMFDLMNARWGSVADMPVVSVFESPFHGLGGWVKRAEDIILSSLILCLIALPMLVIGLAVKFTSKGPVFFKQTRYGLNGKPISVLKFRSMTTLDDGDTVVQATKNDKRVTPLGAFLRRTSLDELPQFINVFTGEMSVVGPRPHAVAHNELYRSKIRGYMLRHKVKPGITGWAQVNGWRGETEKVEMMESRVEHDLFYIDNWSLIWDLQIVFLTIFGRNVRSNAY